MDDSKFFELRYKPNKIYALRFTLDNTDKLLQCLYKFGIDAKFITCADASVQLHIFDTKNSQTNIRLCVGDYILFILNDRGKVERIDVRSSLSHISEDYCIVMKDGAYDQDKYPDIYPFTLRVQRDSISIYWGSLPSGTPVEAREGDYIIFADDSWTIVEKENFNNEYVITDDIEELIYIHKDMEDFEFLGTKSAEITVQIKDK